MEGETCESLTLQDETVRVAGPGTSLITEANILDGTWHHLTVAQAYAGATTVYLDGVVVAAAGTLTPLTSTGFSLGNRLLTRASVQMPSHLCLEWRS
jgi:hypothetical protein